MWYRRYRMLIGIYTIAMIVGAREYLVSRGQEPVDFLNEKWSAMTDVVSVINPGDPDTDFLEAVQALQQGDEETFLEHLEEALSADVKHNDLLLQSYAQHLLNTGRDHVQVNAALNRWRENHPFSVEDGMAAARERAGRRHRSGGSEPRLRGSAVGDRDQGGVLRGRREPALARHHHVPAGTAGGHPGRGRGRERACPPAGPAESLRSDLRDAHRLQRLTPWVPLAPKQVSRVLRSY